MKTPRHVLALLLLLPLAGRAATPSAVPVPDIDPAAFIRESSTFLREREPELTQAEFAVYEQVVPMAKEQPEFALRLLEGLVSEATASAAFDLILGNVYFGLERYPEAEVRFRRAIEKYPNFRRAWENLGILHFTLKRPAEAVPCFSKVLTLGGWEAHVLGLLGNCLASSGNPTAAELAYSQAFVIEPDNTDWMEGLLHVLLETRQFARAETTLRQLARLQPRESRHWEMLSHVLIAQERNRDAIVPLEMAASLGVLSLEGRQQLGDLYADAGFATEAMQTYRQLAAQDAVTGTDRLLRYARVLTSTGAFTDARALLDQLEGQLTTNAQRILHLQAVADWYAARGESPAARRELEALLVLDPLNPRALVQLAEIQIAAGEDALAALHLESAARIPESAFQASIHLARLHVKGRQYAEALARLDAALAIENAPAIREYHAHVAALLNPQVP